MSGFPSMFLYLLYGSFLSHIRYLSAYKYIRTPFYVLISLIWLNFLNPIRHISACKYVCAPFYVLKSLIWFHFLNLLSACKLFMPYLHLHAIGYLCGHTQFTKPDSGGATVRKDAHAPQMGISRWKSGSGRNRGRSPDPGNSGGTGAEHPTGKKNAARAPRLRGPCHLPRALLGQDRC